MSHSQTPAPTAPAPTAHMPFSIIPNLYHRLNFGPQSGKGRHTQTTTTDRTEAPSPPQPVPSLVSRLSEMGRAGGPTVARCNNSHRPPHPHGTGLLWLCSLITHQCCPAAKWLSSAQLRLLHRSSTGGTRGTGAEQLQHSKVSTEWPRSDRGGGEAPRRSSVVAVHGKRWGEALQVSPISESEKAAAFGPVHAPASLIWMG
jgi:hypothetical protein